MSTKITKKAVEPLTSAVKEKKERPKTKSADKELAEKKPVVRAAPKNWEQQWAGIE